MGGENREQMSTDRRAIQTHHSRLVTQIVQVLLSGLFFVSLLLKRIVFSHEFKNLINRECFFNTAIMTRHRSAANSELIIASHFLRRVSFRDSDGPTTVWIYVDVSGF